MTFFQALFYFLREAFLSLVRSWKVSLLAILTITVSLFLGGIFLLMSGNLARLIDDWQAESKLVVYLDSEAGEDGATKLAAKLAEAPWAADVRTVSAEEARGRFRDAFPSLADLLEGWGEEPLPASLEVRLDLDQLEPGAVEAWLAEIRADPAVAMVDDDRDWLAQLEAVVLVIRGLGMVLGTVLLLTAIFTISSVIRLTAYLYRDEIAVMRLVGATEFFIRGPFYVEGLIQGLLGGVLAVAILGGAYALVQEQGTGSVLATVLASDFLPLRQLLALVAVGAFAGLIGAVTSLKRESLGQTAEYPEWSAE